MQRDGVVLKHSFRGLTPVQSQQAEVEPFWVLFLASFSLLVSIRTRSACTAMLVWLGICLNRIRAPLSLSLSVFPPPCDVKALHCFCSSSTIGSCTAIGGGTVIGKNARVGKSVIGRNCKIGKPFSHSGRKAMHMTVIRD